MHLLKHTFIFLVVTLLMASCAKPDSTFTELADMATPILATVDTPTILPSSRQETGNSTKTPLPPTDTQTVTLQPTESPVPTLSPTSMPPLSGSGGGVIAFDSERDGNPEIYMMNADGSDPRWLTNNPFGDYMGDWSPDGSQIVFHSTRDRNEEIYILTVTTNSKGTEYSDPKRITDSPTIDIEPVWSPDGTQIVFEAWLPQEGDSELAVFNLDDNTLWHLTDNNIFDFEPDWSPDANQIVFGAQLADTRVNLFMINPDGSQRIQLTNTDAHDWFANWSPDGEMIAFASDRDGDSEIFVMNRDGSNQRQLTFNDEAEDTRPSWSPDGSKLAFESDRDGDFEIYIIDVDAALENPGSNLEQSITDNDVDDRRAVWRPEQPKIEPELSIEVPEGNAPVINGRLSNGEWDGAKTVQLSGGGELHLLHANGYLFLGIRGPEHGIGSVCHYQNGVVSIMHASAGLGTFLYQKGEEDWESITQFFGCCMDLPESMRGAEQLKQQGWVANLVQKGDPKEMEYQIALGEGNPIIAVTYILVDSPTFIWWPKGLDDDCGRMELVGEVPDISRLQFAPETWVKIIPMEK